MTKFDIKTNLLSREADKCLKIFINSIEKVPFPSNSPYILREQVAFSKADRLRIFCDAISLWSEDFVSENDYKLLFLMSNSSYLRLLVINYLIDLDSVWEINYLRRCSEKVSNRVCDKLACSDFPFYHLVNLNRLWYYALFSWYDPKKNKDLIYYYNNI